MQPLASAEARLSTGALCLARQAPSNTAACPKSQQRPSGQPCVVPLTARCMQGSLFGAGLLSSPETDLPGRLRTVSGASPTESQAVRNDAVDATRESRRYAATPPTQRKRE